MKKFIGVFLAVCSLSAFANLADVDATNDEIRDAIVASLNENDLNCINHSTGKSMKASSLQITEVFQKEYILTVSTDLSQPVIIMEKRSSATSKNVMSVTTDAEFKKVIKLDIKSYNKITTARVNIGTILNPVFVDRIVDGKPFEDIVCQ